MYKKILKFIDVNIFLKVEKHKDNVLHALTRHPLDQESRKWNWVFSTQGCQYPLFHFLNNANSEVNMYKYQDFLKKLE